MAFLCLSMSSEVMAIAQERASMVVCLWMSRTNRKSTTEISLYVLNALYKEFKHQLSGFYSLLFPVTPVCKLLYRSNVLFIVFFSFFCILLCHIQPRLKNPQTAAVVTFSILGSDCYRNGRITAVIQCTLSARCCSVQRGHLSLCRCQL